MTNNKEIKDLLERYFEGETSIEEELLLQTYFKSDKVASEFKRYAPMFIYFESERSLELDRNIAEKIKPSGIRKEQRAKDKGQIFKIIPRYILLRAGVFLFIATGAAWLYFNNKSVITKTQPIVNQHKRKAKTIVFDGSEDPRLAFEAVKSALVLTSNKMKKGTEPMSESFEKVKEATTILK